MFSRAIAALYFVLSLTLLAAAMPGGSQTVTVTDTVTVTVTAPASSPTGSNVCTTGPVQCCNQVGLSSDPQFTGLLGLLNIVIEGIDLLVGTGCSPIEVVGIGSGNACSATTVCCENNAQGGLISIGCIPIIL